MQGSVSVKNRLQFCIISTHTHAHSHSSVHIHSLPIVNVRFGRRYLSCSSLPPLSLMIQQCFRLAAKAGSGYGCCEHHTGSAFSQCRIERQQVVVPDDARRKQHVLASCCDLLCWSIVIRHLSFVSVLL